MIYTIGYAKLSLPKLRRLLVNLDAQLIDCRSRPFSRIPGYSKAALIDTFAARYEWRGDQLGGQGNTSKEGVARLKRESGAKNLLLMCLEEAPGDCHRHHDICWPRLPDAVHIFRGELFTAAALQKAFDAGPDAEYDLLGSSDKLFA